MDVPQYYLAGLILKCALYKTERITGRPKQI